MDLETKKIGFLKITDLISGVTGSLIATFLAYIFIKFRENLSKYKIKKLLGKDAKLFGKNKYYLIYPEFILKKNIQSLNSDFLYQNEYIPDYDIYASKLLSKCDVKASNYIHSELFSVNNIKSEFILDSEFKNLKNKNISLLSIGSSRSNAATKEILEDKNNIFMNIENEIDDLYKKDSTYNYSYILKLKPHQFDGKVWIVCAGLGEDGTSGSSWYLANKYKNILKFIYCQKFFIDLFNSGSFVAYLKTKTGEDYSTEMVKFKKIRSSIFKNSNEIITIDFTNK